MVQRAIKIPKHGGPDGLGLPREAFDELLILLDDPGIDNNIAKQAIELCLGASTQMQWEIYREELIKRYL